MDASCFEELNNSPLLYLSAGSKELFHSDFLYWLAQSHWDVFIRVMRNLAGLKDDDLFWWEDSSPLKSQNIDIRREKNHFDLSIYYRFEANKWVPVLVLENKVKSLPDADQLVKYSNKASNEWEKIDLNSKGTKNTRNDLMTFILLSLADAEHLRNDSRLNLWTFKKYDNLANALERSLDKCKLNSFHKKLCEEYYRFILTLSELWNSWNFNATDCYLAHFCPGALNDEDNIKFQNAYHGYRMLCELRLNDVWQKVSFDRLRTMLAEKLSKAKINCSHFNRNKNGEIPGFYLNTGYTRDTGLIELRYVLENHPFKNDPVCVIIQIQGKQYRYAVTADNIVPNPKIVSPNWKSLSKIVDNDTAQKVQNWVTEVSMSGRNEWYHFGNCFIYRYRTIEPSETVEDILDNIVKDALNIQNLFGRS